MIGARKSAVTPDPGRWLPSGEEAVAARTDEACGDQEDDSEEDLALNELDDSDHGDDHREDPEEFGVHDAP
jgi:hypothetical protein